MWLFWRLRRQNNHIGAAETKGAAQALGLLPRLPQNTTGLRDTFGGPLLDSLLFSGMAKRRIGANQTAQHLVGKGDQTTDQQAPGRSGMDARHL